MLAESLCVWFFAGISSALPAGILTTEKQLTRASYDYIIVGCGAAGLVVANRLSELDDVTVLCIEAGDLDHREDMITIPYYIGLQSPGFYDWQMNSVPQSQLDGAPRALPAGRGVGGGTLTNGMVWNRGNQASYNSWATMGNAGWGWADLLPYFRKSETFIPHTYSDQDITATSMNTSLHGINGPVQVAYPQYFWDQSNFWFQALSALNVPTSVDPNAGLTAGGYFLPLSLDPVSQTRSDARAAYYDAASSRSNFDILVNAQVTRILFNISNTLSATGVEYATSATTQPETVNATKEVILAAGALHTPQLLELSGIGQSIYLQQAGITVLEELPGVGNNLQDHAMVHLNYSYTNPNYVDVDDFATNQTFNQECRQEYETSRSGPWTAKPSQAVAFPSLWQYDSDNAARLLTLAAGNSGHHLPSNYDSTLRAGYDYQVQAIVSELAMDDTPAFENLNSNAGNLDVSLMRPLSRGTVHTTSSDPFIQPAVDPNWLADPFDFQILLAAMQFNQRILDTAAIQEMMPTYPQVAANATSDELSSILRAGVGTEYHYAATAAMLPRELGGVVNTSLIVYGTQNLRVVDTSAFPMVPGAHLQAVTYAFAEKAADIIKGVTPGPAK